MSETVARQHPAVVWGSLLLGRHVLDRSGRMLGTIEAVATSPGGKLRRVGVRPRGRGGRLRFISAGGMRFEDDSIHLPVTLSRRAGFEPVLDTGRD